MIGLAKKLSENRGVVERSLKMVNSWYMRAAVIAIAWLPISLGSQSQSGTVADIVKGSSDSVVLITISDAFGKHVALGSGFIVSPDGKIVTNHHVIKDAHSATVKLTNGASFD